MVRGGADFARCLHTVTEPTVHRDKVSGLSCKRFKGRYLELSEVGVHPRGQSKSRNGWENECGDQQAGGRGLVAISEGVVLVRWDSSGVEGFKPGGGSWQMGAGCADEVQAQWARAQARVAGEELIAVFHHSAVQPPIIIN